MFRKFNNGLKLQNWLCRNFHLFLIMKKLVIATVCAFFHDFYYVCLFFQVTHLFYIFIIKPYRYDFYNNLGLVVQGLITIFYFFMFYTTLYYNISMEILTHDNIILFKFYRYIFFCLIFVILFFAGFYELYERAKVLKN